MSAGFWVNTNGKVQGPFSTKQLKQLAASGQISLQDKVSGDQKKWVTAAKVKGLKFADPTDGLTPAGDANVPDPFGGDPFSGDAFGGDPFAADPFAEGAITGDPIGGDPFGQPPPAAGPPAGGMAPPGGDPFGDAFATAPQPGHGAGGGSEWDELLAQGQQAAQQPQEHAPPPSDLPKTAGALAGANAMASDMPSISVHWPTGGSMSGWLVGGGMFAVSLLGIVLAGVVGGDAGAFLGCVGCSGGVVGAIALGVLGYFSAQIVVSINATSPNQAACMVHYRAFFVIPCGSQTANITNNDFLRFTGIQKGKETSFAERFMIGFFFGALGRAVHSAAHGGPPRTIMTLALETTEFRGGLVIWRKQLSGHVPTRVDYAPNSGKKLQQFFFTNTSMKYIEGDY